MIQNLIAIFLGSGLGGVCRYLVGKAVQSQVATTSLFPWGTFAVNVTGCLLIGLFWGQSEIPVHLLNPGEWNVKILGV